MVEFSLKLYNFIKENDIEFHWEKKNNLSGDDDVIIFVNSWNLEEFHKLIGDIIDGWDSPFEGYFRGHYVCFWMSELFDYCGLELEHIFEKDE